MTVATFTAKRAVPAERIEAAHAVLARMKQMGKRALLAYSGGKDGLVVALLAKAYGVNVGVCEESFYFARQRVDVRQTAERLEMAVVYRKVIDLPWLAKRQHLVFSHDTKERAKFYKVRQQDSVALYALAHGYDAVITGRKRQGNAIKAEIYSRANGLTMVHPLASWDDGDIWAFLRDAGVAVPWIYQTPFGRSEGNSCWPMLREYQSLTDNYRVVYGMEPGLVRDAAQAGILSAQQFMKRVS